MSNGAVLQSLVFGITVISGASATLPIVANTWPWPQATDAGWKALISSSDSNTAVLDAIQAGCTKCEEDQCDGTVGFGGSPDENGETTLDALIMDGTTLNMGAVGALRRVKNAIGVARLVLDNTEHSMLVGELATEFAVQNGFKEESLATNHSTSMWENWKSKQCQPNYHINCIPDPTTSCGPYHPANLQSNSKNKTGNIRPDNHDTIGMIAIDNNGKTAAGTSTNGLNHKIPGRVGDSPIPGAGAYTDDDVGAAVATGDGDVMMRLLPTYQLVENMRQGMSPEDAARDALNRILKRYSTFEGALIGVNIKGEVGAACTGFENFSFCVRTAKSTNTIIHSIPCVKLDKPK
ncbi:N(4)-(Beta-N-acetylglucosaminyl)-L-asparaginase-like [Styela clava]